MKGLVSQANILARIGALGGIYDVDTTALHQVLATLGPELSRATTVTVPITFDRLAVATQVTRERLADLVSRDQLRRLGKLAPDARHVELEIEADGSQLVRTVRASGRRSLAADCELLAGFGVGTLALDSLRDCAAHFGIADGISERWRRGGPEWLLHFARDNRNDEARATTRAQILTVARKLAATPPQCNLIDGLHDMLAKDRDSFATLEISPDQTSLQLAVRWQQLRWETVVRMAIGFQPKLDAGSKLGELSGAFDAEQAAALELVLGPQEPPVMRVSVTFAA